LFSRVGNLKILLSYLNANRKSLFMKVVTLALVTISVSCSFFFLDSFQPQFSLRYMNTIKAKQSDVILSFDYSLEDYLEDGETIDELIYADMLANNFSSQFEETFGKNTLSLVSAQKSTNAFSYLDGYNSTLAIVNANNLALELLKDYSVEENSSVGLFDGGILLLEENLMKYSPDSALFNESNLILSNGFSDIAQHNFSIDFHAKVLWDYESTFSQNITKIIGETSCALVVSDAIFKDYLMFVNTSTSLFDISSSVYLDIDYSTISFNDQFILKEQLSQFVTFAQGFILDEYSLSAEFSYELNFLSFLNELRDVLIIINVLILIFTIPIILFSLLILLFSYDFFARKRSKLFSFYYSKGSSIRQLFLIIFSENILALFLALVFGIGLSLPFTMLMVNYPNFLSFQEVAMFQINYSFAINPFNIFWIVLIVAILSLLLVLIDLKPILSQKVTQKELETEDDFEQKIASWKKFYFDFLLLIAGFGILLFERFLFQSSRDDFITQFFVYFNGILVIIVAMALLFLRFTPNFLSSTGNYLWRKIGGFFSFITRLFRTRKKALARNILSFVLCVSYLLALVQMVSAIDHFSTEQAYFTVGADARIDFSSESNITSISSALPTTIHSTEVTKLHLENHLTREQIVFYTIDTDSFLSAAYFSDNFIAGDNPSLLMDKLAQNMSFIVARSVAEDKSWTIGYNYTLTLISGTTNRTSLQVADYFLAWPFFVDGNTEGLNFIISEDTREVLQAYSTDTSHHLLLNFPDNTDYSTLSNDLQEDVLSSNEELVLISDGYEQFWSEPFWIILNTFSIVNLYLISLLFILFSIITTVTLENSRKTEIGLFHALGLQKRQIFSLAFTEQVIIFVLGLIFGIVLGLLSSIFLNNKLQSDLTIPIETTNVYWYVGVIILGIVIYQLVIIIISALRTSTRNISFFIQELEIQNELDD